MSFLDILARDKVITKDDISYVTQESQGSEKTIEQILKERGITSDQIQKAKGEFLEIPSRAIGEKEIPFDILKYIPEESASHYKIIPLGVEDSTLEVGFVDPDNIEARDALNFISQKIGMPYRIFLVSEDDFVKVLDSYRGLSGEVSKALGDLDTTFKNENLDINKEEKAGNPKDINIIEDAPVTKIVATILRYAIEGEASDIHIEPMAENVRVRFRVDGTMNTSLVLPVKVREAVVSRIKILCNMKLDERRKPQDGRFSARIDDRKIDFRVSTFPTYYGEKVVMRILDQQRGVAKLSEIGFTEENLALIMEAINKPYGLVLISGPTGSGKSTTLYSMLNEIDRDEQNVLSLEDPIEYNIAGMNQSQVHPEIGYTFATGLRTTLRQDPDVIMVGEIRDKETAQLAIQAALTGHLVLSTIHTNSSVGIVPRLVDMGIDPYLIAPTLILGMAQRLVGKAYLPAVESVPVDGSFKAMIDAEFADLPAEFKSKIPEQKEVYRRKPTPDCPKGTKGRLAVTEVYKMDRQLEEIILKEPTELSINKYLRSKGMLTMKEDAMIKALKKIIPFEEVSDL
ncbi:MAG: GspE/PulE family protein [bacterium]